jgi:UDP-N-acetylglucosamine 4,6-dehydratase
MTVVLVTGAAGSLGRILVKKMLEGGYTVRALDINEAGLAALEEVGARPIYGDIRSLDRMQFAMRGCDRVVHTAALKNLVISEKNPHETIETNVNGTANVARAAIEAGVKKAVFVSSDKAVEPTTLYGTTKLMGEFLWLWYGRIQEATRFIIIRPGNFWASSGNVFEVWETQHMAHKPLTVTNEFMERYFIDTRDVADLILHMLVSGRNREVFVPEMEQHRILELAKEKYPTDEIIITGIRPGEKQCECLFHDCERGIGMKKGAIGNTKFCVVQR